MQIIKQYLEENDRSQSNYQSIVSDNYAGYPNFLIETDQYRLLDSIFIEEEKVDPLFQFALETIAVELVYITLAREIHESPFLINFQHYDFIDDDTIIEEEAHLIDEISRLLQLDKSFVIHDIESNEYLELEQLIGKVIQSTFEIYVREIFMTLFKNMTEQTWKELLDFTGEEEDWDAIVYQLQQLCSDGSEVLVV